jgi:hypothetical protein
VRLKQGDRQPPLIFDLSGDPAPNLAAASAVRVLGWRDGTLAITDVAPTISGLTVTHNWVAPETDTLGRIWFEVDVTDNTGKHQTFPALGQVAVDIEEALD